LGTRLSKASRCRQAHPRTPSRHWRHSPVGRLCDTRRRRLSISTSPLPGLQVRAPRLCFDPTKNSSAAMRAPLLCPHLDLGFCLPGRVMPFRHLVPLGPRCQAGISADLSRIQAQTSPTLVLSRHKATSPPDTRPSFAMPKYD
jgi:hypothetical protein